MNEKAMNMLEEILEVDEGELTMDMELEQLEEWDSISKLALMAEVKKGWDKKLTVEDIRGFRTIKDICEFLG